MAKETTSLSEFIVAYQDDLAQHGFASLSTPVSSRAGSFVPPADTSSTYDEAKQYPWIPEFSAVTENIMAIVSNPRTHLKVFKEVTQAEKAHKIDNTDVTMTLKVPRFWKEKDNRMLPEYIYSDTAETDYAIYENRFLVALIDKMRSFISHIIVELYNRPRFLTRYVHDSQVGLLDLNYLQNETTDPLNPLTNPSALLTDKDDPIIATLRKLLDAQRILSHSVSTPFYKEVKKAKGLSDSDIHATNMLIGDRNYAACFQFYMKLINLSADQNKKEQLLENGYCNWAIEKMLEVYRKLGFKLSPERLGVNKQGLIDIERVIATRGALKATFKRDGDSHLIINYNVADPSLGPQGETPRRRRARISIDFMPGVNASLPTVDDLSLEINHLLFHRLTPEQDFENAFVLTAEQGVHERGAVIANPTVAQIDANIENMIRSCITFLQGDAWTYSRICPICGAYMDGENEDGNFYCPNCDSVYSFVSSKEGLDHNEMIWVKRLHSPTHNQTKTETMVLNVLRTTADIETEHLVLRLFDGLDLAQLYDIASVPGPLEMMGEVHTETLEQCQLLLDRFINRDYRAIVRTYDNKIIGAIGLDDKPLDGYRRFSHKKVEFFLGEEYWGRGYATEALRGMVDHAFNALHLDMLWAAAGDFNLAGIKVLSNSEFSYIDRTEDTYHKDIVEANELRRYVIFNPKPTMLGSGGGFMNQPIPIEVPELYNDVRVDRITEEDFQKMQLEAERLQEEKAERDRVRALEEAERQKLEAREKALAEDEALRREREDERTPMRGDAREAARRLVEAGLRQGPTLKYEPINLEEDVEMPKPIEPINIEITEDQTVEMEINGVRHILYQGKQPAAKPVAVKPAPKKEVKPEPKPAPEKKPEPAKSVKKVAAPKAKKPLTPTRKLASFGPGISDDNQHSIHTVAFEDKVKAAPKDIRNKYKELSAYLTDVYGCGHRVSFGYDSYRVGKKVVVALSLGGVHLRVNTALDPKFYDGSKMRVNDDSDSKKYKDLPSYIKVIGDKSFKQAFRLIDDTMKSLGVKKIKA